MQYTVELDNEGTLEIPADLRKLYQIDSGDVLTLLDIGGIFVLSPQDVVVPELVDEIQRLRDEAGVSLDELIQDTYADRKSRNIAAE